MRKYRERERQNRLIVLNEIYELQKDYPKKSFKEQEQIDIELIKLGNKLIECNRPRRNMLINRTLKRGKNMKSSEIVFLIDSEVPKEEIAKKLKVTVRELNSYLRKINYRNKEKTGS